MLPHLRKLQTDVAITVSMKSDGADVVGNASTITFKCCQTAKGDRDSQSLAGILQKSLEPQRERSSTENLLLAVKRVCDNVIRTNNEQLPTMFADRQEFENFRKSPEQRFLSAITFTAYKSSLKSRLKSIEERLSQDFCLWAINFYSQKQDTGFKSILSGLKNLKGIKIEGILPFLAFLFLAMFAVYLISSITN